LCHFQFCDILCYFQIYTHHFLDIFFFLLFNPDIYPLFNQDSVIFCVISMFYAHVYFIHFVKNFMLFVKKHENFTIFSAFIFFYFSILHVLSPFLALTATKHGGRQCIIHPSASGSIGDVFGRQRYREAYFETVHWKNTL